MRCHTIVCLGKYGSREALPFVSLPQRRRWLAYICGANSEPDEESIFLRIICIRMCFGAFLLRGRKVPKRTRPKEPMVPLGTPPSVAVLRFAAAPLALWECSPLPFSTRPALLDHEDSRAPFRSFGFSIGSRRKVWQTRLGQKSFARRGSHRCAASYRNNARRCFSFAFSSGEG